MMPFDESLSKQTNASFVKVDNQNNILADDSNYQVSSKVIPKENNFVLNKPVYAQEGFSTNEIVVIIVVSCLIATLTLLTCLFIRRSNAGTLAEKSNKLDSDIKHEDVSQKGF